MDTDPDSRVGSVLDGRYRVLERLAEGGMGVVYRAERVPVGRPVAVKFLHEVFASDRESRARFERETRVLFKLTHPHCVSVIDFGVDGGPYVVMDFVPGTTLKDRLENGPIPVAEAITIARQALAGLAHAHAQGIVHRDIKPANIMVTDEIGTGNHVRILDFGLARLRGSAATSVTQSSIVVGTPNYMAPEQTFAGEVDARTDIYAVGVVLFEMLIGQRPFTAEDTPGILDAHRHQPPPHLHEMETEQKDPLPMGLDRVLQRALAKKPEDRFQSAVAMAEALDAVAEGRRAPSTEPGIAAPRRPVSAFLFVLVLLAGAVAAYVMIGRGAHKHATPVAGGSATTPDPGSAAPTVGSGAIAITDVDAAHAVPSLAAPDAAAAAAIAGIDAQATAMITTTLDAGVAPTVPDAAPLAVATTADAAPTDAFQGEIELDPVEVVTADPTEAAPPVQAPDEDDTAPPDPVPPVITPPTPVAPATSIAQALDMAQRGQREPAIAGLRALWRKSPGSGRLPYVLGNMYYDKKWWSVAMEHYRAAIKQAPVYRRSSILIHNVIHMLGHPKTRGQASWVLKKVIGPPARPYLRAAAKSDPKPSIRAAAKWLLR